MTKKRVRHIDFDLIRAVNPEGEDLLAEVDEPPFPMPRMKTLLEGPGLFGDRGEWDMARDALIARIDAVRPDLDWDLRREIRDLLALVADLVLCLPSAEREGQKEIRTAVNALVGQVAALKPRLGD